MNDKVLKSTAEAGTRNRWPTDLYLAAYVVVDNPNIEVRHYQAINGTMFLCNCKGLPPLAACEHIEAVREELAVVAARTASSSERHQHERAGRLARLDRRRAWLG